MQQRVTNGTDQPLVAIPSQITLQQPDRVAVRGVDADHPAQQGGFIAPGRDATLNQRFDLTRIAPGEPITVDVAVYHVTDANPLAASFGLARHIAVEGLSCVAETRSVGRNAEHLTGYVCDWSGAGWLQVDHTAQLAGPDGGDLLSFRRSKEVVAPGGSFELSLRPIPLSAEDAIALDGSFQFPADQLLQRIELAPVDGTEVVFDAF